MKKSISLWILLFLSFGLFAQKNEPFEIYHFFQKGDTLVLSSPGYIRVRPSLKGKSIDQLPVGHFVYIDTDVEGLSNGGEVINNFNAHYYPVRYEKDGQWKSGYVWGGLIANTHSVDKSNNRYIIGRRSFDSENYEITFGVTRIDGTTGKIYEQLFKYVCGDQSSFESKILGNMGLSNIHQIFRVGLLGEACGIYTTYHYYGWNGEKFIELPTKNSVGDAGVFGYSEKLLFPSEHKLGNFIIVESETVTSDYVQYEELEGQEFEIEYTHKETKIYFWNGETAELLEPIKIEY